MQGDAAFRPAAAAASLRVCRWSSQEWLASEVECERLTRVAAGDALFLSWEWLSHWWSRYGTALGTTDILAFYRRDNLVGLAPLFRRRVLRSGLMPMTSVQVIGLSWRDPHPLISEYLDVIAAEADIDAVRRTCLEFLLAQPDWSEFVVGFTAAGASWAQAFAECAPNAGHYARELDRCVSYEADLSAGFGSYLRELSQSTRRSVWNLRRRVAARGHVELETVGADGIAAAFGDLNRLHQLRWGKPAFEGIRLEFHVALAQRLVGRDELALSRLRVGGQVVSVLYDIRKPSRQYNIKIGFDPSFSSRISLGYIHLGFAMEAAADRGIPAYDFLAGPGRTSDFKRLLSQRRRILSSVQMLRGRALASVFRLRDRLRPQV
jgi:CelD/BcsL family acetyltransferase involved in cellulose biosynthesis